MTFKVVSHDYRTMSQRRLTKLINIGFAFKNSNTVFNF